MRNKIILARPAVSDSSYFWFCLAEAVQARAADIALLDGDSEYGRMKDLVVDILQDYKQCMSAIYIAFDCEHLKIVS